MKGVQGAADRAVELACRCLAWKEPSGRIHDVQADPRFRDRGVDLLWELPGGKVVGVEVKGDRYARKRNYFFELVSNVEKDTPGWFLYSVSDWVLYVFLDTSQVHLLPLRSVREWFLPIAKQFELKHTRTRMGQTTYTTVGAVVPISSVLAEVSGLERFELAAGAEVRAL